MSLILEKLAELKAWILGKWYPALTLHEAKRKAWR